MYVNKIYAGVYNCKNISYKGNDDKLKFKTVNLIVDDMYKKPELAIEIIAKNDVRDGYSDDISNIYMIARQTDLSNNLSRSTQVKKIESDINDYYSYARFECNERNLSDTISFVKNNFLNNEINPTSVDYANNILPVVKDLQSKDMCKDFAYKNQYNESIAPIQYNDIKKYNEKVFKNSEASLTIYTDKASYAANQDTISNIINATA